MDAHARVPDGTYTRQPTPRTMGSRCPCGRSGCILRVRGDLRGPRPGGLNCDAPLLALSDCGNHSAAWPCRSHRASRCVPCSWQYRRLIQRMASHRRPEAHGYLYLLTLTAPGDQRHALPDGTWCECTPDGGVDLAEWNPTAGTCWNRMRTALRRDHQGLEFFRAAEVQKRGALHLHVIVWSPDALDVIALRRLGIRCGFGHSTDLAVIEPGSRKHAYYVSKYVTKACDERHDVPWETGIDRATGEVLDPRGVQRRPTYRTWSSSRGWGLTMRECRAALAEAAQRNHDRRIRLELLVEKALAEEDSAVPATPETG